LETYLSDDLVFADLVYGNTVTPISKTMCSIKPGSPECYATVCPTCTEFKVKPNGRILIMKHTRHHLMKR